jgi:pimeloyl-ACP methyl ester carboxylesterase
VTETTQAPEVTTHTLEVPGAVLSYDVRKNESTTEPPLMLIGQPMAAAGFATLAGHFSDRTVVTYDPRGSERSTKAPDDPPTTPDVFADDLDRVITEVGGPVDLFASSGGAIDALALVARYPNDVRTLVAHEPPISTLLPDREEAAAAVRDIYDTYQRDGFGPAMAKFIGIISYEGPIPADWASQPAPDPAMFGLPTEDDGTRTDPLFNALPDTTGYDPDFEALRAAPTHIVMALGEESTQIMAGRGALAVAERLGTSAVIFPGGHGGFFGGEYGQMGKPEAFAAKLREVLDSQV